MWLEDYPWFCPQPFMNIVTDVFGKIKPCCVIKGNNKWDDQDKHGACEYSKCDTIHAILFLILPVSYALSLSPVEISNLSPTCG